MNWLRRRTIRYAGVGGVLVCLLAVGYLFIPRPDWPVADLSSGSQIAAYETDERVVSLDYDASRSILAAVVGYGREAKIEFWDCSRHTRLGHIHEDDVTNAYFLDSNLLVSSGRGRPGVSLWRCSDPRREVEWPKACNALVCEPQKLVAMRENNGDLNGLVIVTVKDGRPDNRIVLEERDIASFAISPTGLLAITNVGSGLIKVFSPPYRDDSCFVLAGARSSIFYSRFLDGERTLVCLDTENRLTFWDVIKRRKTLVIHFARDLKTKDRLLVASHIENGVERRLNDPSLLDLTQQVELVVELCYRHNVLAIISPLMKCGEVMLLDIKSGQVVKRFRAHPLGVEDIKCIMNGEVLVTCGMDRTIRFWNLTALLSGVLVQRPLDARLPVSGTEFTSFPGLAR